MPDRDYKKKIVTAHPNSFYHHIFLWTQQDDRHGRGKQLVTDIRITFNDNPRRGRGRRGGRGGMERGRGGPRGGQRMGGRQRENAPRFDDEADFPSLVKSAA